MKLVEILAREMSEWPEYQEYDEIRYITQGNTSEIMAWEYGDLEFNSGTWESKNGLPADEILRDSMRADDYKTAVITRADWEAERARIKREKVMPKPNKYGWIRHRGGKCPVEADAMVEVRFRDGDISRNSKASSFWWDHNDCNSDIMAWRPHKPVEQRIIEAEQSALADKDNEEAEMPAAKYFDGPLQWRDRIREIDAARKEEEARHCSAMAAYDEERASLVSKLKAEGFVLIQSDEPNTGEESAQQDMRDPANWRAGDVVEIVSSTNDGWLSRRGMLGNLEWDG